MVLTVNIILLSYYLLAQDFYGGSHRYSPALLVPSIMVCCYIVGLAVDEVRQVECRFLLHCFFDLLLDFLLPFGCLASVPETLCTGI